MLKNQSGQKLRVFAFNRTNNTPVTGDAANITCKVSIDNAALIDLEDVNPVETEDGYYLFSLTQAETNGDVVDFYPESSTSNVQVIAAHYDRQTTTPPIELIDGGVGGLATSSQEYGPKRVKTPNLEVEQFDPLTIQKARDREATEHLSIADLNFAIATPNRDVYRESKECGC